MYREPHVKPVQPRTIVTAATETPDTPKVPYTAKQRVREGMKESEKAGVERWNVMITTLQAAGLMEDK